MKTNKKYIRVCGLLPKRDISNTEVYKVYKKTGIVEYEPILKELKKRTHLPRWICKLVYEAEGDILHDLGIIED